MNIHHLNLKLVFQNKVRLMIKVIFIQSSSVLLNLFYNKVQGKFKPSRQDFFFRSAAFDFTQLLRRRETLQDAIERIEKAKGFRFARHIDLTSPVGLITPPQIDLIKDFKVVFVNAQRTVNTALWNNQIDNPSTLKVDYFEWLSFI